MAAVRLLIFLLQAVPSFIFRAVQTENIPLKTDDFKNCIEIKNKSDIIKLSGFINLTA